MANGNIVIFHFRQNHLLKSYIRVARWIFSLGGILGEFSIKKGAFGGHFQKKGGILGGIFKKY